MNKCLVGIAIPSNPGITKQPAALAIFLLFILSPISFIAELWITYVRFMDIYVSKLYIRLRVK